MYHVISYFFHDCKFNSIEQPRKALLVEGVNISTTSLTMNFFTIVLWMYIERAWTYHVEYKLIGIAFAENLMTENTFERTYYCISNSQYKHRLHQNYNYNKLIYCYAFILWQPHCSDGAWQTLFIGFQCNTLFWPVFTWIWNWNMNWNVYWFKEDLKYFLHRW